MPRTPPQLCQLLLTREISPEAAAKTLGHLQWLSGSLQRQKAAEVVLCRSVLVCSFLGSCPGSSGCHQECSSSLHRSHPRCCLSICGGFQSQEASPCHCCAMLSACGTHIWTHGCSRKQLWTPEAGKKVPEMMQKKTEVGLSLLPG